MRALKKVLIANRGEIALRIKRAAQKLGIVPVMIASEADRESLHALPQEADGDSGHQVMYLSGNTAQETYLNGKAILALAKEAQCDSIHPGYGFLSENGDFAEQVGAAGLKFIGPTPEVIRLMGDKVAAKAVASKAGVPIASSVEVKDPARALKKIVKDVGFPILLKAQAGGGGRGMRLVKDPDSFLKECERASAEAKKFFSNENIFAERYIESPRHVEVQVFGDGKGKAFHLGTRDCSTQRRHQKLVEEAPAPFLSPAVRKKLHESAVSLAEQVQYEGAGTVEFLVQNENIFFLEMNTRIQVEHPVTEIVYGIDLVEWQFRVAAGESPRAQDLVKEPTGHSIEFRIYAENPAHGFVPSLGTIRAFDVPDSYDFFRNEPSVQRGSVISPYYDALLTKIIVSGYDRDDALQNARRVLKECRIEGVESTLPFHHWLLHESSFPSAPFEIGFLDREFSTEKLENVSLYERIDPENKNHGTDAAPVERLSVKERSTGDASYIEIVHRKDGLFEGRRFSEKNILVSSVMSHTRSGVLASLEP